MSPSLTEIAKKGCFWYVYRCPKKVEGNRALTLYIGSFLRVFSNSQGGSLLLLSSSQQVSHTLIVDLQKAAGPKGRDNTLLSAQPGIVMVTQSGFELVHTVYDGNYMRHNICFVTLASPSRS